MKNKKFFYLQYDLVDWRKQKETKINAFINRYIAQQIVKKSKKKEIAIFDIGLGIGSFFETVIQSLKGLSKKLFLAGCEPSKRNYVFFSRLAKKWNSESVRMRVVHKSFQEVVLKKGEAFDFVTAIYVFPHFVADDLKNILKKIRQLLCDDGLFVLVLANDEYIKASLKKDESHLFIEENILKLGNKKYKEVLHYTEIPKIGTVVDFNREESYYLELFRRCGFLLKDKKVLNDEGFICTLFVFGKMNESPNNPSIR